MYGGDGIAIDDDLVTYNNVSNYYRGIYAHEGKAKVYHNDLMDNSEGVRCTACDAYIENNLILKGSECVQVYDDLGSPYVANNTMSPSRDGYTGVNVHGGNPEIVNNTIYGAKWGIIVEGGAPSIHGRNRVENNTVTGGGYGLYVTGTSPFNVTDNNTFKNNSVAGIYLGANTQVTIRDNNTIADNDQYGIWIDGDAAIFDKQVWWNDVKGNGLGIYVDSEPSSGYFHAECNWWDNATGPYDPSGPPPVGPPDWNPDGTGQFVSNYFHYRNETTNNPYWLKQPSLAATSCKV